MIEYLIIVILIALASYEITDLLVNQVGPLNIFEKIRQHFGVFVINDEVVVDDIYLFFGQNIVGKILSCPYCTKVWVVLCVWLMSFISIQLLIPLAAMGIITILLDNLLTKQD